MPIKRQVFIVIWDFGACENSISFYDIVDK